MSPSDSACKQVPSEPHVTGQQVSASCKQAACIANERSLMTKLTPVHLQNTAYALGCCKGMQFAFGTAHNGRDKGMTVKHTLAWSSLGPASSRQACLHSDCTLQASKASHLHQIASPPSPLLPSWPAVPFLTALAGSPRSTWQACNDRV